MRKRTGAIIFGLVIFVVACGPVKDENKDIEETKVVQENTTAQVSEKVIDNGVNHDSGEMIEGALVCIPESLNETVDIDTLSYNYSMTERLEVLLDNVTSGGPGPDGIPPIEGGTFQSIDMADEFLIGEDKVFVLELSNIVYVFPQRILVWHEIVNLEDEDIALTYCPLTGSAISYMYPKGYDTSFGTSGNLINSNLLMYDRHTDAYISQIDGIGLNEALEGVELNSVPTFWTSWDRVKGAYKEAFVLTTDTGHRRNYNNDPYGSYTEDVGNNYYSDDGFMFNPLAIDDNQVFTSKYPVIGVKAGDERIAIDPQLVKELDEVEFMLNDLSHIAIYDQLLDTVRVYIDIDDIRINAEYFQVMWFAWYGFYSETEVLK